MCEILIEKILSKLKKKKKHSRFIREMTIRRVLFDSSLPKIHAYHLE